MSLSEKISYWCLSAEQDWGVAGHLLEIVTDFNLEARYPDEKFLFYKRCTKEFTQQYLDQIEGMRKWLLQKVQL